MMNDFAQQPAKMLKKKAERSAIEEAKRLLIEAAMDLTKLTGKMRKACMLVLLDGYSYGEAANKVKRRRQNVYRAVKRVLPRLKEVQDYAETIK